MVKSIDINTIEKSLLAWYDIHQRVLPWRKIEGYEPNPYHVWLSEIMLQQTTVATVKDYFARFVTKWPILPDLANATLDEIFHTWQGLGYYSRARNLHLCAQKLMHDFNGQLPQEASVLKTLPGIGPYTSAAIAAIAYDEPIVPVDGNIVRVFSRVFAIETPLPLLKNEIQSMADRMKPSHRSGDFAQGLMDLGATICKPRNPSCASCPLQSICQSYQKGIANRLPVPAIKTIKPHRYGIAFWIEDAHQKILLEKRPSKGLLAGLMGLPTTAWTTNPWILDSESLKEAAPQNVINWDYLPLTIRHTFTHFHLELKVAKGYSSHAQEGVWASLDALDSFALPTVMKKVIQGVLSFSSDQNLPK